MLDQWRRDAAPPSRSHSACRFLSCSMLGNYLGRYLGQSRATSPSARRVLHTHTHTHTTLSLSLSLSQFVPLAPPLLPPLDSRRPRLASLASLVRSGGLRIAIRRPSCLSVCLSVRCCSLLLNQSIVSSPASRRPDFPTPTGHTVPRLVNSAPSLVSVRCSCSVGGPGELLLFASASLAAGATRRSRLRRGLQAGFIRF